MLSWLIESDKMLFELINGHWQSPWLDLLMPFWRDKKNWIPLYIIIAIILFWKYKLKAFPFLILVAIVVLLGDQLSSEWIKKSVMRIRPCNDSGLQVRLPSFLPCGSGYSFTSSHATNHFALAYLFIQFLLPLIPKAKVFYRIGLTLAFVLWATLVAYAQVYVGVHYPLDVFCGALLGVTIAALSYFIFQKIMKSWSFDS